MKVVAKENFISTQYPVEFKKGEIYDAELTVTTYDPNTFQPIKGLIIVKSKKGWIKEHIDNFYTLEEVRELKLKDILE